MEWYWKHLLNWDFLIIWKPQPNNIVFVFALAVLASSLVVSLLSGRYIGSVAELARKELDNFYPSAWPVEPLTMEKIYKSITRTDRPRVFLDLIANEMSLGRIILELRGDVVPRTAENFRALCAGKRVNLLRIAPS